MFRRMVRVLTIVTAVAIALAFPGVARASSWWPSQHVICPGAPLATAYGPIEECVNLFSATKARVGFVSPFYPQDFNPAGPEVGFITGLSYEYVEIFATDGFFGTVAIVPYMLETPYGAAIWGTQERLAGNGPGEGRWGVINVHTNLFYPSSAWTPLA